MTHNNDNDSNSYLSSEQLQKMESLQIELQNNPKSPSFPQLADLYLAQNMIEEAQLLLQRSLKYHPNSISGHMLMGRVFQAQNKDDLALEQLHFCIQKAPSNWACYLLRAQLYLKQGKPKLALKDYKQVMLYNPQHMGVRKSVARLENLTADEYEEDFFKLQSLSDLPPSPQPEKEFNSNPQLNISKKMERVLSLIDALIVRQEYEKAIKLTQDCHKEYGEHPEINLRVLKLSQYETAEKIRPKLEGHLSASRQSLILQRKQKALELLLRRIRENKISPLVPQ